MKVLIIEDEVMAANRLEKLVNQALPDSNVIAKLDSVKETAKWFVKNEQPDLVFMDIQLADGLSFEIFEIVKIDAPIIFTTAYDQYALEAFKVSSIDYLLKPIDMEDLSRAINKLHKLAKPQNHLEMVERLAGEFHYKYKNRFIIKVGEHIKSIAVDDIQYFFSRDKATYCTTSDGKNYLLDFPLDQLESKIDPTSFFRINRKYLISLPPVKDMISYTNSRLKIVLAHTDDNDIIVSRERVQDFKKWLDR